MTPPLVPIVLITLRPVLIDQELQVGQSNCIRTIILITKYLYHFLKLMLKSPLIHIYCINYEQKVGHIQTIFFPFCQIGNTIAISETIITSLCNLMDSISLVHNYVTRQDRVWIVNDKLIIV